MAAVRCYFREGDPLVIRANLAKLAEGTLNRLAVGDTVRVARRSQRENKEGGQGVVLAVLPQFFYDVKYVGGVEHGVDACFVERIKLGSKKRRGGTSRCGICNAFESECTCEERPWCTVRPAPTPASHPSPAGQPTPEREHTRRFKRPRQDAASHNPRGGSQSEEEKERLLPDPPGVRGGEEVPGLSPGVRGATGGVTSPDEAAGAHGFSRQSKAGHQRGEIDAVTESGRGGAQEPTSSEHSGGGPRGDAEPTPRDEAKVGGGEDDGEAIWSEGGESNGYLEKLSPYGGDVKGDVPSRDAAAVRDSNGGASYLDDDSGNRGTIDGAGAGIDGASSAAPDAAAGATGGGQRDPEVLGSQPAAQDEWRPRKNDLVEVDRLMTPGVNRPGGVARVVKVDATTGLVDVRYVVGGHWDRNIEPSHVHPATLELNEKRPVFGRCVHCGSYKVDCKQACDYFTAACRPRGSLDARGGSVKRVERADPASGNRRRLPPEDRDEEGDPVPGSSEEGRGSTGGGRSRDGSDGDSSDSNSEALVAAGGIDDGTAGTPGHRRRPGRLDGSDAGSVEGYPEDDSSDVELLDARWGSLGGGRRQPANRASCHGDGSETERSSGRHPGEVSAGGRGGGRASAGYSGSHQGDQGPRRASEGVAAAAGAAGAARGDRTRGKGCCGVPASGVRDRTRRRCQRRHRRFSPPCRAAGSRGPSAPHRAPTRPPEQEAYPRVGVFRRGGTAEAMPAVESADDAEDDASGSSGDSCLSRSSSLSPRSRSPSPLSPRDASRGGGGNDGGRRPESSHRSFCRVGSARPAKVRAQRSRAPEGAVRGETGATAIAGRAAGRRAGRRGTCAH
ncbi:unnamed protein product [Scytosiphon promiscuus]